MAITMNVSYQTPLLDGAGKQVYVTDNDGKQVAQFRTMTAEEQAAHLAEQVKKQQQAGYYVDVKTADGVTTLNLYTVTDFLMGVGAQAATAQDELFLREYKNQVGQLQALKDINAAIDAVNTAKANGTPLPAEAITMINKLVTDKKITLDATWTDLSKLTTEQLDTLRSNLTTAQSSQSATNEEASMKLNEAANTRSAIFTQLHTMLQTLIQLNQTLSRW